MTTEFDATCSTPTPWTSYALAAVGLALFGAAAAYLVERGNPGNMGLCGICFVRDSAGALGLHSAAPLRYLRPEIPALLLGAFAFSLARGQFSPRGGSTPVLRFLLGALMAIGALVFLGCPTRMLLRIGGGDANALLGLAGFAVGVAFSQASFKGGFSLGRSEPSAAFGAGLMPLLAAGLIVLAALRPVVDASAGGPVFASTTGGGAAHAPIWLSAAAGILVGAILQGTHFCVAGTVRDALFSRQFASLAAMAALIGACAAVNAAFGRFQPGLSGQPVSHAQHLWNFLPMVLVGWAAGLAGGCPVRQVILAGEGNSGAGIVVLGMVAGTALAQNFRWVSSPQGPSPTAQIVVGAGLLFCAVAGFACRRRAEAAA